MSELQYYTYDSANYSANQLLGASSTLRYSLAYWFTVQNDSENLWWRYSYIPGGIVRRNTNNTKNDHIQATVAGAVIAIAAADVIGYFVGIEVDRGEDTPLEPGGKTTYKGTEGAAVASASMALYILFKVGWI